MEKHFVGPDTEEVKESDSVVPEETGVFDFGGVVMVEEHYAASSEVMESDIFVVELEL